VSKENLDNIIIELLHCSLAGCMTTQRAKMSDKLRLSHWASQKLPKATASTQTLLLRLHLNSIVTDQLHNKGQNLGNLPRRLLRRLAENDAKLIADEPPQLLTHHGLHTLPTKKMTGTEKR
jgi:hypothetical protein